MSQHLAKYLGKVFKKFFFDLFECITVTEEVILKCQENLRS